MSFFFLGFSVVSLSRVGPSIRCVCIVAHTSKDVSHVPKLIDFPSRYSSVGLTRLHALELSRIM